MDCALAITEFLVWTCGEKPRKFVVRGGEKPRKSVVRDCVRRPGQRVGQRGRYAAAGAESQYAPEFKLDRLAKVIDGPFVVLLARPSPAASDVSGCIVRITLNNLVEVTDGLVVILPVVPALAAVVESPVQVRVEPDGLGVVLDGLIVLTLVVPVVSALAVE